MAPPNVPPRRIEPKVSPRTSSLSPPLESIPDEGSAATKRKCISSACMPCRKRRSKCDGKKPSCHGCDFVYHTTCYYDLDSDHRRKGALRRDIQQLKEGNEKRDVILEAIRKGSEAEVEDIIHLVRANPDEPYDSIAESIKRMSINPTKRLGEASTLEGELEEFSAGSPLIKADETRHYGHTSNLALIGSEDDLSLRAVDQFGTWTSVTNDVGLIQHLLSLYFTWSHPIYLLFSEDLFLHSLRNNRLEHCSPMLVNAVLALACNYSDRPDARLDMNDPTTLGNRFFTEAKRLLAEDDRSCLTTVQALGVMALQQAMNNQDSKGWKYTGQMMTMAIELGLHLTYNVKPNGQETAIEAEARRITLWGSYVTQTVWAVALGRIAFMPRTAIEVEKPPPSERLERKIWRPYGDPRFSPHELTGLEQPACRYTLLDQLSRLSEIVNDTVQMFYAPRDRITSRRLQLHHENFRLWYKDLPSDLAIRQDGRPTLPQVITLHIYYHSCIIQLFRPFLRVSFVQTTKPPRQICTEAAITISQLMELYFKTYSSRPAFFMIIHCAVSAAIIHLVNISSQNPLPIIAAQSADYLSDAIRILNGMYPNYPILIRHFSVIRSLISKWVPVIPNNVREALDAIDLPLPDSANNNNPALSPPQLVSGPHSSTTSDACPSPTPEVSGPCDPFAPEFTQMTPNLYEGTGKSNARPREFLWTPFPENPATVPVMLPDFTSNQSMDISRVLDSGVDGDWPQLNRDGFTMDGSEAFLGFDLVGNQSF
ncbi:uncharacterized protein PAC_01337 [Phialocephala subalpina]|uniref:Zn(2)-C6 fungal-type domain-containing protein n=1 Tax=Phialocephala subalpina TaxID=576137 RepID=A0A1L7WFC0_9HELO|nr:uncharacterized protein PAC_01337 [Phialocephala subalpina]